LPSMNQRNAWVSRSRFIRNRARSRPKVPRNRRARLACLARLRTSACNRTPRPNETCDGLVLIGEQNLFPSVYAAQQLGRPQAGFCHVDLVHADVTFACNLNVCADVRFRAAKGGASAGA
jgi:hypothetical protein